MALAFGQSSPSATYNGPDTTTQGNWVGQYGGDGYQIANGSSQATGYGSVNISASAYTWTSNAGGSPALLSAPNAGTYIASAYLAGTSFTMNVNLTDGKSHTVAFYLLDWDGGGQRAETITVQNAATGASFPAAPAVSFTGFNNGVWVSYTVTGNVNFVISSNNAYLNAVVSGVFFSAPTSTSQSQSITFNNLPGQTVGTPLTLTATATSGLAVDYAASPGTVCSVSGATATFLTAGSCTITASQAGNSSWAAAAPISQTFAVSSGSSGQPAATYVKTDATTGGAWTETYGSDGYQIANGSSQATGYGSVNISASAYTWTSNASGSPALLSAPGAGSYIASAYLAGNAFTINVNLTDGNSHTVSFYLLDWDGGGQRAETITVQNAATGASFPAAPVESFTDFENGVWVSYTVTGNVNFVITSKNSYLNAVVSGVFFDTPASATPPPQSQSITFNSLPTQTVGTPLTLTATASSGLTVAYSASPSAVCSVSGATATFLTGGSSCTITASQAGNSSYAAAIPMSQTFSVSTGSGQTAASYLTSDTTTGGNWTAQYGSEGYQIANGSSQNLSYGSVDISASAYTWTTTASGSPALLSAPSAGTYIASAYLAGNAFTINVNLTDGKSHTVAFYLLDWDGGGQRKETITVQNAATGASFPAAPAETFTGFNNGVWVSYTVTGNVNFVISSNNSYLNAVVSGVFFGAGAQTATPPQPQSITFNPVPTQTVGTPLTLTATASSGLTVAYSASPSTVCSVSGASATFLTGGSSCTITASQAGNSSYAAATPVPQSFAVNGISSGPTAGIYDDRDPLVTYKGTWASNLDPNRYNGTQSYSNHNGDSASFTFTGTQVSYVYARQANLGNLQVSIDGQPQTPPANLYSATDIGEQVITYPNLANTTHTITVTVAGTPVSGSSNSYVVIDAFIVGQVGAFAGAYDDQDPAIVYSSGWGMNSSPLRYDLTQHYSNQAGSTASFTFTGTQVNYVYEMQGNTGQAQVSIDGKVVAAQLDQYAGTATGPTIASYTGLANATHTITVTALGISNSQSSNAYVIVDAFFTGPLVTISGAITSPVSGSTVVLGGGSGSSGISQTGNTLESVTVGTNGTYSFQVPAGPNYTVTPSLANATFSPTSLSLPSVVTNLTGQNFTATVRTGPVLIQQWNNASDANHLWLLSYGSDGTTIVPITWTNTMQGYASGPGGTPGLLALDINGDGKMDVVQEWNHAGTLWLLPYLWDAPTSMFVISANWIQTGTVYGSGPAGTPDLLAMDVNGDGKADLVQQVNAGGYLRLIPYISTGTTFVSSDSVETGQGYGSGPGGSPGLIPMDINGDGKIDLLQQWNNGGYLWLMLYISNGTSFTHGDWIQTGQLYATGPGGTPGLIPLDINGDGKMDLVQQRNNGGFVSLLPYYSNGSTLISTGNWFDTAQGFYSTPGGPGLLALDMNGDGKTDLVQQWECGTDLCLLPYFSNGAGFTLGDWKYTNQGYTSGPGGTPGLIAVDVNLDGKMDLVQQWDHVDENGSLLYLLPYISNGTSFTTANWINTGNGYGSGPDLTPGLLGGNSLDPTSWTYTIGGVINGPGSLAGVSVALSGSSTMSTTTDSSGLYSFEVLAGGNYTVTPTLSGYTFNGTSISFSTVMQDQTANFTATANGSGSSGGAGGLTPSTPLKEYIFLNGQVIAIEHAH